MPKARLLARAGWEPVTRARTDSPRVLIERYGKGPEIYLAVMSKAEKPQVCTITVEEKALGLSPRDYPQGWMVDEIALGTPVRRTGDGRFTLRLDPYRTCILALRGRPAT